MNQVYSIHFSLFNINIVAVLQKLTNIIKV